MKEGQHGDTVERARAGAVENMHKRAIEPTVEHKIGQPTETAPAAPAGAPPDRKADMSVDSVVRSRPDDLVDRTLEAGTQSAAEVVPVTTVEDAGQSAE